MTGEVGLTTTTETAGTASAEPTDEELAAFVSRLSAAERGPLERYVRALIGTDAHRAEDVVQEALLRAWLNAGRLIRECVPPRPWLFAVARNIAIDWHRRDLARPREVHDGVLVQLVDAADHIERILDRAMIADALAALPDQHREVLYHLHYCDRSGQETAELVGIPRGTVKSRTYYAVRALRRILGDRGLAAA
jgi:RNA polymerase sigma-70 factor, ECF subfamily